MQIPKPGNDNDERAVSPVIGVILMVAITVILAAVIAAFVLDMGNMGDPAPNTVVDTNDNPDWQPDTEGSNTDTDLFYISHESGDEIDSENLRIILRDDSGGEIANMGVNDPKTVDDTTIESSLSGDFGVGSTITVTAEYDGSDDSLTDDLDDEDVELQLVETESESTITSTTFHVEE